MDCSIIICTRNRAPALANTLRAFRAVKVPAGWQVELIVADNGSDDDTAAVVTSASHPALTIRHLWAPQPGKSRAQNAALTIAQGEALLFTDDDVEPSVNWLEAMARPLLARRCDAVAGRILLAEELQQPWLSGLHAMWLAQVREPAAEAPELIGANMGIHRSVFSQIGCFDEELGPGASGFGEETLVWLQMKEAGMRIEPVHESWVVHRPDPMRLLRTQWLAAAERRGRSQAYLLHHWEHRRIGWPAWRARWIRTKLGLRRLTRPSPAAEGCPLWEMSYLSHLTRLESFMQEQRRPRNYDWHALRRNPSTTPHANGH